MNEPLLSTSTMRWACAHSRLVDPRRAVLEVASSLLTTLGPGRIDLVLAFFTTPFLPQAEMLRAALQRELPAGCLAGASGAGVIARRREFEGEHALSVVAARLPGIAVRSFMLPPTDTPGGGACDEWLAFVGQGVAGSALALFFADRFTFDAQHALEQIGRSSGGVPVAGGCASGGFGRGRSAFFLNDWTGRGGGVLVALEGAVRADFIVSHGCRPIGGPLSVTRAERNLLVELDRRPAIERIRDELRSLDRRDLELVRERGLLVGKAMTSGGSGPGEWIIHSIVGHDPRKDALAIADVVAEGERIRLHVPDGETARADLRLLLVPQLADREASAALVFCAKERGRRLFGEADEDISAVQSALGGVPAAGLFCDGEIGPARGRNLVHHQTASVVVVRPV
jgi:small ligand-binding sensory domain FIST